MSRNPYIRDGQPLSPLNSVFAFVDILGYKDLIHETQGSTEEQKLLIRLHDALSSSRKCLGDDDGDSPKTHQEPSEKDRFVLRAFTDNIAIGWPIVHDGESELGGAFEDLAFFQLEMANTGFFVRGAISVGSLYLDEIVVFGNALMESYEGETSLARDPRIVLTQSARHYVTNHLEKYPNKNFAPQTRHVLQDTDGQWFVNYLDTILYAEHEQGPFYSELEKHKESVELKLEQYRQKPPIFSKYAWTASYHNHFCELHNFHEYKIDVESFSGERKFIIDAI